MFEAYINRLRLLRRYPSDLDPSAFRHVQTFRDPAGTLAEYSGNALWIAGHDADCMAIAWPWGLIQQGIPAIDPLQVQTNLLLLASTGQPLPEYQALAVLVHVVNRLDWHGQARRACGQVPQ